jgi:hypothetical protein
MRESWTEQSQPVDKAACAEARNAEKALQRPHHQDHVLDLQVVHTTGDDANEVVIRTLVGEYACGENRCNSQVTGARIGQDHAVRVFTAAEETEGKAPIEPIAKCSGDSGCESLEATARATRELIDSILEERLEAMFSALAHGHEEVRQTAEQAADLARQSVELATQTRGECARLAECLQEFIMRSSPAAFANPLHTIDEELQSPAPTPVSSISEALEQDMVSRAVNEAVSEARAESLTVINTEFDQWRSEVAHEVSHALVDVAEHADRLSAMEDRILDVEDLVRQTHAIFRSGREHSSTAVPLPLSSQVLRSDGCLSQEIDDICSSLNGQAVAFVKQSAHYVEDVCCGDSKATSCPSGLPVTIEEFDKAIAAAKGSPRAGSTACAAATVGSQQHWPGATKLSKPVQTRGLVPGWQAHPAQIYSPGVPAPCNFQELHGKQRSPGPDHTSEETQLRSPPPALRVDRASPAATPSLLALPSLAEMPQKAAGSPQEAAVVHPWQFKDLAKGFEAITSQLRQEPSPQEPDIEPSI